MIINGYPLDEKQMKPILENPKYSLIIAGAGSGKTMTLIGKIKYLLTSQKCREEEILCLSFTNETVRDLQEKIFVNTSKNIEVLTFHKLALKILQKETFSICDESLLSYVENEFFESLFLGNESVLRSLGKSFFFKPTLKKEIKIIHSKIGIDLKKDIHTFIKLYKANNYDDDCFTKLIKEHKHQPFLLISYALFLLYEREKDAQKKYDFDDLIQKAILTLKEQNLNLPYKYILIDEFQDTSKLRFDLILEILKQTDASLCVIGDDYQSIYRFSGCDLKLFLNFKDIFKDAKIYKLTQTYRNSEELIKIAGNFIMKNPYQIKKELTSPKHLDKPIVIVYYHDKTKVLNKLLEKLDTSSLMVLGRNEKDIFNYPYDKQKYQFKYLTVHKSKGLEAENVIVLNLENTKYGFPNQIKEQKVLSLISESASFPFDEERRLFYVALTRTKNYVYLLVNKKKPSIFIRELLKNKKYIQIINL